VNKFDADLNKLSLPNKNSMKTRNYLPIFIALPFLIFACKNQNSGPWHRFMACAGNACVAEVIAVKDLFLSDPKPLFEEFIKTSERGEDHFVGWTYLLRDSVLLNPSFGSPQKRFEIQQSVIAQAKLFETDPRYGEWSKSMISVMEEAAIISELEDDTQITGTYTFDYGKEGGTGEIKLLAIDDKQVRFDIQIVGKAPGYNQGMMADTAALSGNIVNITCTDFDAPCIIKLTISDTALLAETIQGSDSDCGFGHGIRVGGVFERIDDLDPFRGEGGDVSPETILGTWVSTSDAKSQLKIADGQYIDIYNSKVVNRNPYSYHKVCPEDCGPIAQVPCIKVTGQDDVCYTVVKTDGKILELSMIGGTGKSLLFKRKGK
jgi:hypothetical protein